MYQGNESHDEELLMQTLLELNIWLHSCEKFINSQEQYKTK